MNMLGSRLLPQLRGGGGEWWNNNGSIPGCIAAYAPKGAVDLASSYINLANPGTYDASAGVAPTWNTTDGWMFNGTTQHLTTGIVATIAKSMIVRFSNVSSSSPACVCGTATVGLDNRFAIFPVVGANHAYGYSGLNQTSPNLTQGVMAIAENSCYLNGAGDGVTLGSTIVNTAIFVGGRNAGGAADLLMSGNIQAIAIYGSALTAGEISALTERMNAL